MLSRLKISKNTQTKKLEILLTLVLLLTVIDTTYLSWRFIALQSGFVEKGTGICSWSDTIDCDKVLSTSEARAFYVPNAILGFGFYFGCFIWWMSGKRLGDAYRYVIIALLMFWLFVAAFFTFYFFWLLVHLDVFCPFCPWNHFLTWTACVLSFLLFKKTHKPINTIKKRALVKLIAICVVQFFFWQLIWLFAYHKGIVG